MQSHHKLLNMSSNILCVCVCVCCSERNGYNQNVFTEDILIYKSVHASLIFVFGSVLGIIGSKDSNYFKVIKICLNKLHELLDCKII